jgi:hypothetical protein
MPFVLVGRVQQDDCLLLGPIVVSNSIVVVFAQYQAFPVMPL